MRPRNGSRRANGIPFFSRSTIGPKSKAVPRRSAGYSLVVNEKRETRVRGNESKHLKQWSGRVVGDSEAEPLPGNAGMGIVKRLRAQELFSGRIHY